MTTYYRLLAGALPDLRQEAPALIRRLDATAWPDLPDLPDAEGWMHGAPLAVMQRCARAWARWLTQPEQATLGQHDVVPAGRAAVHTVRFSGRGQLPLLLLHGWPTSFLAFHSVIEPLREVASEVILATLPGFGTSPLPSTGWSTADSAAALLDAMTRLGHDRFLVHGQDWGSVVARKMGCLAPERVAGVHVSAGLQGFMADGSAAEPAWDRLQGFAVEAAGYLRLQARRPDSIAVALSDSPAGLLAWQLDKYQLWQSRNDEWFGLGEDFVLANATLYWMTNCVGSSMRIYSANRTGAAGQASSVPTAVSVFGAADFTSPAVCARDNRLIAWQEHPTGGHVAALDASDKFAQDLAGFASNIRCRA